MDYRLQILRARVDRALGLEATPVQVPGERHHPGNLHAIFLLWQPRATPWYVRNALDALAEVGVNVTVVVNHPLSEERMAELLPQVHRVMLRNNSGRDMGGYRDGILSFLGDPPERLLIMNDSVYYFRSGLTEMFQRLATSSCDVCATFENWEIRHHIQSFCYSISRHMLEQRAFQTFWRNYLPVNARPWAINKGEAGSSRCMLREARSVEVLFNLTKLRAALVGLDATALRSLASHLPLDLRASVLNAPPERETVLTRLLEAVLARSQIHSGGFLFRRFLGAPLIKRDLLFRQQYHLYELEALLLAGDTEDRETEIMAEYRAKGIGHQLQGLARQRFLLEL